MERGPYPRSKKRTLAHTKVIDLDFDVDVAILSDFLETLMAGLGALVEEEKPIGLRGLSDQDQNPGLQREPSQSVCAGDKDIDKDNEVT